MTREEAQSIRKHLKSGVLLVTVPRHVLLQLMEYYDTEYRKMGILLNGENMDG